MLDLSQEQGTSQLSCPELEISHSIRKQKMRQEIKGGGPEGVTSVRAHHKPIENIRHDNG